MHDFFTKIYLSSKNPTKCCLSDIYEMSFVDGCTFFYVKSNFMPTKSSYLTKLEKIQ